MFGKLLKTILREKRLRKILNFQFLEFENLDISGKLKKKLRGQMNAVFVGNLPKLSFHRLKKCLVEFPPRSGWEVCMLITLWAPHLHFAQCILWIVSINTNSIANCHCIAQCIMQILPGCSRSHLHY